MAKVILICGKICSGKTHYSQALRSEHRAVLLSCDEIESQIFHHALGDRHDIVAVDIRQYLHRKAVEIVSVGCNVVLDWGFWTSAERAEVSRFYASKGIEYEWHYVDVADDVWMRHIASRNAAVSAGTCEDYYVDEGLFNKLQSRFEVPDRAEIDVWVVSE